jgi:hypothetical protein
MRKRLVNTIKLILDGRAPNPGSAFTQLGYEVRLRQTYLARSRSFVSTGMRGAVRTPRPFIYYDRKDAWIKARIHGQG